MRRMENVGQQKNRLVPECYIYISRIPVVIQVHDVPFSWAYEGLQWPGDSSCYNTLGSAFSSWHKHGPFWLIIILFKMSLSHKVPQNMCIYAWVSLYICSVLAVFCHSCCWAGETCALHWSRCCDVLTAGSLVLELRPLHPTCLLFPKLNSTVSAFLVTSTF